MGGDPSNFHLTDRFSDIWRSDDTLLKKLGNTAVLSNYEVPNRDAEIAQDRAREAELAARTQVHDAMRDSIPYTAGYLIAVAADKSPEERARYGEIARGIGGVAGAGVMVRAGITARAAQVNRPADGSQRDVGGAGYVNVPNTTAPSVEDYVAGLYTKATPTSTNAGLFEVEQTGPLNYRVTGGGTAIDADGYQGTTLLDAKYVGNPASSPYVDGSNVPKFLQDKIYLQQQYEFQRYHAVIADPGVPFNSLNALTNERAAVPYFQRLMNQYQIPGEVQVVPTNIPQTVSPKP